MLCDWKKAGLVKSQTQDMVQFVKCERSFNKQSEYMCLDGTEVSASG